MTLIVLVTERWAPDNRRINTDLILYRSGVQRRMPPEDWYHCSPYSTSQRASRTDTISRLSLKGLSTQEVGERAFYTTMQRLIQTLARNSLTPFATQKTQLLEARTRFRASSLALDKNYTYIIGPTCGQPWQLLYAPCNDPSKVFKFAINDIQSYLLTPPAGPRSVMLGHDYSPILSTSLTLNSSSFPSPNSILPSEAITMLHFSKSWHPESSGFWRKEFDKLFNLSRFLAKPPHCSLEDTVQRWILQRAWSAPDISWYVCF